ncbi:MAG: hydroxymethylbilane synthase, partial [Beggiatoa sp. IS2]
MSTTILRIATRKSPLALWQAQHVGESLRKIHATLSIEFIEMTTQGDKILDAPLANLGGKGLFVKELEQGLLENQADIAVHSMKDVPVDFPNGLILPVIMQREDPCDAFVSNRYARLAELPTGACVGTSSLRRQSQLLALRPDLHIRSLRGNVGTRLRKLDNGEFDGIVLAAAGLRRLGMTARIREVLSPDVMLPAIGQGAIGIECRADDLATQTLIAPLNDTATHTRIRAERAINRRLGGNCQVPIAGFAEINNNILSLRGLVADLQGQQILRSFIQGDPTHPEVLGDILAQD